MPFFSQYADVLSLCMCLTCATTDTPRRCRLLLLTAQPSFIAVCSLAALLLLALDFGAAVDNANARSLWLQPILMDAQAVSLSQGWGKEMRPLFACWSPT
jgi:hypothetical protein